MYSEQEIIEGFRRGDQWMFRHYFYEYCRVAYNIFDKKYALSSKENLDFMSLAHQYAIYLIEHYWKPLEDRSPKVSLRTWMINGFRYIVLDALKWYKREYGSLTFDEYIQTFDTFKLFRIVCDECQAFGLRMRCNEQVVGTDQRSLLFQLCADEPVCLRSFRVKVKDLDAVQKSHQADAVLQRAGTVRDAIL